MFGKDLSEALGGIGDEKITAAMKVYEKKQRRRSIWLRAAAVAAVLAIILAATLWPRQTEEGQLIIAPGVVRVYAYDLTSGTDVSQLECVELEQGVEMPYEYGWSAALNWYPGVPITLSMPENEFEGAEITFEVSVNGGEFLRKSDSVDEGSSMYLGQNFVVENNQTICWNFIVTYPQLWDQKYESEQHRGTSQSDRGEEAKVMLFLDGKAYADIIIWADGNIVGCMTVMFYADNLSIPPGSMEYIKCQYYAKLIGSIICPKQDGEYQNVSREQMEVLMESWK